MYFYIVGGNSNLFLTYITSIDVYRFLLDFNYYLFNSILFRFWNNNFNITFVSNVCKGEASH